MDSINSPDASPTGHDDLWRFQWSHHTVLSRCSAHHLAWNNQSTSERDLEHAPSLYVMMSDPSFVSAICSISTGSIPFEILLADPDFSSSLFPDGSDHLRTGQPSVLLLHDGSPVDFHLFRIHSCCHPILGSSSLRINRDEF
jgi:hypothetical protein